MENPKAGDVIEGVGGLRKLRYADARSCKGKRGGLMVIFLVEARSAVLAFYLVRQNRNARLEHAGKKAGEPDVSGVLAGFCSQPASQPALPCR